MPKHDWPHYFGGGQGWLPTAFLAHSRPCRVCVVDFQQPIDNGINALLPITTESNGLINAVRISARAHLAKGLVLGATNALNGDKILPIDETQLAEGQTIWAQVSYHMGGGLASFQVKLLRE